MKKSIFTVFSIICTSTWAVELKQIDQTVRLDLGLHQACFTMDHTANSNYSAKDIEKETKMCSINLEISGLCPKLTSTSAGVKVFENNLNLSLNDFNTRFCIANKPVDSKKEIDLKSLGKFKHTMDLTYAQSNLVYYHLSRSLDAGRVPVSVMKTLNPKTHQAVAENAILNLKKLAIPSTKMIYQSWANLQARYKTADPKSRRGFIDDSTGSAVGVMIENIKGDFIYSELDTFPNLKDLSKTPAYRRVFSEQTISNILGTELFQKIAASQIAVQMKDISDMIIMDTILNQIDRYGNIGNIFTWYHVENNELKKTKADYDANNKILLTQKTEMKSKNAVLVKEMVLIDNDAGLIFESEFNKKKYVEHLTHASPRTYSRLLELYKNKDQFKQLLTRSLLVGPQTAQKIEDNLVRVMSILIDRCKSQKLKLDLDRDYLIGLKSAPDVTQCE